METPLKPNGKLDISVYRNFTNIHRLNTENSVVETLLGFNKELSHAYEALQAVMSSVRLRDNSRLRIVLDPIQEYPEEMEKHMASNQSFIENALRYKYSNGPLEGTNNKFKVLKRVAYGFKSFLNFRLRIHLMFSVKKVPSRKAARH